MTARAGPQSVAVATAGVHVTVVENEKVLYVQEHQTLHHLDPVGALVWDCLEPAASLEEIATDLAAVTDSDAVSVLADIVPMIDQLVSAGALVLADEPRGDVKDLRSDT